MLQYSFWLNETFTIKGVYCYYLFQMNYTTILLYCILNPSNYPVLQSWVGINNVVYVRTVYLKAD